MPTKTFPAYLFLGEEDFLKEQSIEKLKSIFLSRDTIDLNYSVFYAKDKNFNFKEMSDNLNTSPFLSKKRLIVLRDADSLPTSFKQSTISYLRNPKESSVFVIESAEPAIKGEFLLEASRLAHLVYHRRLRDSDINVWLIKKASSSGKKILPEAINAIKESLPNDLRILSSAMDNIILYVGRRVLITKQDVEKVIGLNPLHTSFDLIDSIEKRDVRRALCIFFFLRNDRKKETELIGLLAWNARMLLRIKELLKIKNKIDIRRDVGLHFTAFEHISRYASGFKKSDILKLLDEILKADLQIKTGASSTLVIEQLIIKMCTRNNK
jgi:DNA polymerase-3 subunit delta